MLLVVECFTHSDHTPPPHRRYLGFRVTRVSWKSEVFRNFDLYIRKSHSVTQKLENEGLNRRVLLIISFCLFSDNPYTETIHGL